MTNRIEQGKVIPFAQKASFFMKRGAKEMEKNDLVSALYQYRRAFRDDPLNAETCLAIAEILSQMQRYEESNRILLVQMSMGESLPESFFGIACNYFGMHEYNYAADSLDQYLALDPNGYFAYEAEDFLDLIDDDDAMAESTGLCTDEDYDTDAEIIYARHLMDAMEFPSAVAVLERHIKKYPNAVKAKNQLALAYYCLGEKKKALALTEAVLSAHKDDVRALCNAALFYRSAGNEELAREKLAQAAAMPDLPVDALHNVSILHLEFSEYAEAEKVLNQLVKLCPYDENVLHRMGYCRFMLGDAEGALHCYKKLLRMNPDDTVAKYYFGACKRADGKQPEKLRWSITYQVPFSEAFRRLNQINRYLNEDVETQKNLWKTDTHFKNLIIWALNLPENQAKSAMLSLLYTYGDAEAERILRDFLLRTDQADEAKRVVLGMLKRMGAKEPFMAYLNGDWISSKVSMLEYPERMPPSYEAVLGCLMEYMVGERDEACVSASMQIFKDYIERFGSEKLPRISRMQEISIAAGLEFLGCERAGQPVSEQELCKKYRISAARLHNAVERISGKPEAHG